MNEKMERNVQNTEEEDRIIKKVSGVGIYGNVILTAFKFFAGIYGKSGAMVSDAVHSLSDVFATLIAFIGVKISKQDADQTHPYGHERMECVASLCLGGILLITGLGIGKNALGNIFSGSYDTLAVPGTIALIAAVVSIVTKEGMFWYTRHYAKILNSSAFMADAWHHRSDAFSSVGSLIGIAGARLGFPILDSVASMVICLFIMKVAVDIFRDAIDKMIDKSGSEEMTLKIRKVIEKQDGVEGIDDIKTRMFAAKLFVDVEIAADGNLTLTEAHQIAERVHSVVEQDFEEVKHCMVHVNPAKMATVK